MSDSPERVIPSAFESEQATIGSMLLEAGALTRALAIVSAGDFYWEDHQRIVTAIEACHERREPVDMTTVAAELRRCGLLEQVGGAAYLMALISSTPTAAHVVRYATIVAEKASLRDVIVRASAVQQAAYENPEDVGGFLARAGDEIASVHKERVARATLAPLTDNLFDTVSSLVADCEAQAGIISSARFGIGEVDKRVGGLEAEKLVVIKADTKHGKSQLARQALLSTARCFRDDRSQREALVFVLEEGQKAAERKMIAWLGGIDSFALLKKGWWPGYVAKHPQAERGRDKAISELATLPIRMTGRVKDMAQIEACCRAAANEVPVGLVIIDYFQLVTGDEGHAWADERGKRSRAERLQALADELDCPVICPSQVSYDKDTRRFITQGARALEHNASLVIEWQRDMEGGQFQDTGMLGCVNQRNGPGFAPVKLRTRKDCGWFMDEAMYHQWRQAEEPTTRRPDEPQPTTHPFDEE